MRSARPDNFQRYGQIVIEVIGRLVIGYVTAERIGRVYSIVAEIASSLTAALRPTCWSNIVP